VNRRNSGAEAAMVFLGAFVVLIELFSYQLFCRGLEGGE